MKDEEVDSTTKVSDYIDTGGITVPCYFEFDLDGVDDNETFRVSTVELNRARRFDIYVPAKD
ncbi:MAG: hypothetical protein R3B51_14700 [Thermodesulfobacteriota bacterium]